MNGLQPVVPPLLVVPRVHGEGDSAQIYVPPDHQAVTDARLHHLNLHRATGVLRRQTGVVKLETTE